MGKRFVSIAVTLALIVPVNALPPPRQNRQSWPNAMASSAARPIPMVRSCQVSIRSAERQRPQTRRKVRNWTQRRRGLPREKPGCTKARNAEWQA
jgi:hypothetical protein